MERRDFLKILGLSGVALTMPKPLDIIAAKMSDLTSPPLHVGYCEIRPVYFPSNTFVEDACGITTERALSANRYVDYARNWSIRLFIRKGEDKNSRVLWMQGPARMVQDPAYNLHLHSFGKDGHHIEIPTLVDSPFKRIWTSEDIAELWILPGNRDGLPKYVLPKLKWIMRGTMLYREEKISRSFWHVTDVQTVQVDRARAIEMGLALPSEPEGIIA
jgi:hypothetical protein